MKLRKILIKNKKMTRVNTVNTHDLSYETEKSEISP
jgi:hypothetical protein